jgi:muramoyltetrapeptide carboxypeptidase LdcA involved in peptidoglycan recycling
MLNCRSADHPGSSRRRSAAFTASVPPAVRVADGVLDRTGYLAGNAQRRAAGLLAMFSDPEISMMMAVSGGTGVSHLV